MDAVSLRTTAYRGEMNYQEVFDTYSQFKEILASKKEAIIKKDLEKLSKADEDCKILCEKIAKFDFEYIKQNFTQEQKDSLRELSKEIKIIQENNDMLTKYSLNVINNLLTGILNIVQPKKNTYNAKGEKSSQEDLDICSITEEA